MVERLTVSALGCLTLVLVLSGCTPPQEPIQISAKPVEKQELVLPGADPVINREVKWVVATPDNIDSVFAELDSKGRPLVLFGLDDTGYKNVSMNLNDLRSFIQQQNAIIAAYDRYYKNDIGAINK